MEENNNALNWYNFKENSTILQIGTSLNCITELLKKNADRLICVNSNKNEIESLNDKFDYIILYSLNNIKYLKQLLKDDGIALLIVDNKFAISAFAGSKPQEGKIFETIMEDDEKTFSKNSIEKVLKEYNFIYNFYYLLPHYRMPNVIFSDKYMPNENTTKIMYNISYLKGSAVVFDELKALKQITKDGQFSNFANSYLVEINNKNNDQAKFISFNNSRKPKYRLITKIYDDFVEKIACSEEADNHIQNIEKNSIELEKLGFDIIDKKREKNIYSKYINTETFDKILVRNILDNKINETYRLIENWYKYLTERLINYQTTQLNSNIKDINLEKLKGCHILKNAYIDLVFENIFFQDNKYTLFDQEWCIEEIPLEFILYRSINNLYIYNQEINNNLPYNEIMKKFKLEQFIEEFKKIEKYAQNEIIDENMTEINQKSLNQLIDINATAIMNIHLNDYEENSKKQDIYIKSLEEKISRLEEVIEKQNSYIQDIEQRKFRNRIKRLLEGGK